MAQAIKECVVDCPISTVYNQWTQFEDFPEFMNGVDKIVQTDDTHLHWSVSIMGQHREWDAEITEQEPDSHICWKSLGPTTHEGQVSFQDIGAGQTKVTCQLDFEPEGPIEGLGDVLGFVDKQLAGDMERFKDFIENRGAETGAWRGEV